MQCIENIVAAVGVAIDFQRIVFSGRGVKSSNRKAAFKGFHRFSRYSSPAFRVRLGRLEPCF